MKLTRRLALAAVILLVLFGFALRLYRLDAVPLRGDEAYSVMHWTAPPFSERWVKLLREEPAPVGAFTLYWAWNSIVGRSEFATRFLSLLGNIVGMAVTFTLACRLLRDNRLALLAAALWTVHPFLIWHAQDARTYGVSSALTPLAFYSLLRATQAPDAGASLRPWRPYILAQLLGFYVYYLEPFWWVAQGLYVLTLRRADVLKRALMAWAMVGLLSIPVLIQLYWLIFVSRYQGTAEAGDFSALLSHFAPTLFFGENVVPVWAGGLFVAWLFVGLAWIARRDHATGLMLLLWIAIPPLLLYGASFFSNYFRPRYVTTIIPALLIALVAIAARVPGPRTRLLAALALTLVIGLISLGELGDYFYRDPPKAPDWPGLASYLQARSTPEDALVVGQLDPAIEYYYTGASDIYFVPAFPAQPQADIERILAQTSRDYRSLWVAGQTFPDWPNVGVVERWLESNLQQVRSTDVSGLRIQQYMPWGVRPDEIEQMPLATFGDVAELVGAAVFLPPEPTHTLTVWLYWRPLAATATPLKVFVHLLGAVNPASGSPLWTQDDRFPQNQRVSTTSWELSEVYRDVYSLPLASVPPGNYRVLVGFYDPESGQRLPVGGGDSYPVQSVRLAP